MVLVGSMGERRLVKRGENFVSFGSLRIRSSDYEILKRMASGFRPLLSKLPIGRTLQARGYLRVEMAPATSPYRGKGCWCPTDRLIAVFAVPDISSSVSSGSSVSLSPKSARRLRRQAEGDRLEKEARFWVGKLSLQQLDRMAPVRPINKQAALATAKRPKRR